VKQILERLGTLRLQIQQGSVKVSEDWKSVYFCMKDLHGICGVEEMKKVFDKEKNEMKWLKMVKSGSRKGIWSYGTKAKEAKKIVVCESAVDALSFTQLHRDYGDTLYLATMGKISQLGKEVLQGIAKVAKSAEWIIATDNDTAGEKMAEEIKDSLVLAGVREESIERIKSNSKDWNDELKAEMKKKQQQQQQKKRQMQRRRTTLRRF